MILKRSRGSHSSKPFDIFTSFLRSSCGLKLQFHPGQVLLLRLGDILKAFADNDNLLKVVRGLSKSPLVLI